MNPYEMEGALAAAWPVPWREQHASFELRASPEGSNRGNCVRLLGDSPDVGVVLESARRFFTAHHRVVQVAVPDHLTTVDRRLADDGFVVVNPSLYMSREAPAADALQIPDEAVLQTNELPKSDWLRAWSLCAELAPEDTEAQFAIVRSIGAPSCFVALHDHAGGPLAVGTTVRQGRWRCFENLATHPNRRGRGLGTLVLRLLAAQPTPIGTRDVLQVDADSPAVRLYERHGFRRAHSYHYRRETPADAGG